MDVPADASITVTFKEDFGWLSRYLEHDGLNFRTHSRFAERWSEYDGENKPHFPLPEALVPNPRQHSRAMMVLRLRDEFVDKLRGEADQDMIERMRYNIFGLANSTYYGGDTRSWQRYTFEPPIDGRLEYEHGTASLTFNP